MDDIQPFKEEHHTIIANIIRESLSLWGIEDTHSLEIHGALVRLFAVHFSKEDEHFPMRQWIDYVYRKEA